MLSLLSLLVLFIAIPVGTALADELSTEEKYKFLVKEGIFTGFTDGSSHLNATMTREQFAAVLFRLWELREDTTKPAYNDVLKTRWSFKEIGAVTKAGLMQGIGNGSFAPAADVTTEQLAAVLVRGYSASSSTSLNVHGKVSAWAKRDVGVALYKGWITEKSDYRKPALRSQLVHAAYSVYIDLNPNKNPEQERLNVRSVTSLTNNTVVVQLHTAVRSVSNNQFDLEDENRYSVGISRISLSNDGKQVTLTTDKQQSGKLYTLYIDRNQWTYKVISSDTTKPKIVSHTITAEAKIEIVFSEPVDTLSAENKSNYTFNNNLSIVSISVSSDKKKVTITTAKQAAGTVYTLTVRRIEDLAGNVIDTRSDLYFGAVVDKSAPTVSKIVAEPNKITLTFNEELDSSTATRKENYALDGGLVQPRRVDYDETNKTVTLTTVDQVNGQVYNLTLNGIKDKAGNLINSNTKVSFSGNGKTISSQITLQRIDSVNENTLELYFDRSMAAISLSDLTINVLTDNGTSISNSGWRIYYTLKQGDERAIQVQFRTKDNSNPALFKQGHVYEAKVTGISKLETSNDANIKRFAGLDERNHSPYAVKATAIHSTSITVDFSEPIKNVSRSAFQLIDDTGRTITIAPDQLNDKNKISTQLTLYLSDSLKAGKTYTLSFNSGITDAAGWNELIIKNGSDRYTVTFQGVD